MKSFEEMIEAKQKDNDALEAEVAEMEKEVEEQDMELIEQTKEAEEAQWWINTLGRRTCPC